ncbi:hypothetical protein I7I50_07019 [Histoplasma capsulatum G186AR]|uniref:Uncharacterized protein n=1 Tax=Ajellomyces capsulatus TaxID=5037 RepID=A0A8H7Z1R6_AJECA|nr:hypothetical protein I7I52_09907 [Histoplasma capsulatum]QSS67827.1 hypothetical protein I7I50_07019 [Histoplasma capsulatum G186AR]
MLLYRKRHEWFGYPPSPTGTLWGYHLLRIRLNTHYLPTLSLQDSDREFLILAKHALVLFEKGLFQLGVSSDWPGREFLAAAALKTMCIEAIWGCHA